MGVEVASLDEDLLLFSDGGLHRLDPGEDVTMGGGELVGSADLYQVVQRFLVLLVSELE
jgi:hypothetical protein